MSRSPFLRPLPFQHRIPEIFGPMMSARADMRLHHVMSLEPIVQRIWMSQVETSEWLKSVRSALWLAENALQNHPHDLAPIVMQTADDQVEVEMEVIHLGPRAGQSHREEAPDARFRPLLDFYQCLYERYYPRLIVPFVVADRLLRGEASAAAVVEPDGRVPLSLVEEMERARGTSGVLTAGLNRHLRNSISHGRYSVRGVDVIEMEDRDPRKGTMTWGPHQFTHRDLHAQVFRLHITCDALLAALIVFDVNNARLIAERRFAVPTVRRRRLDVIRASLEAFATTYLGLDVVEVKEEVPAGLRVVVKALGRRELDQDSEILEGGPGFVRKYVQRIRTEEGPLREQVYGLIQMTWDLHEAFDVLRLDYVDDDRNVLGELVMDLQSRKLIRDGLASVEQVRAAVQRDSLPDLTIPVVVREAPKRV